jgi:hypothetical protein
MMKFFNGIVVIVGLALLPTILFILVSVIYHGNFTYINPYELVTPLRVMWAFATTIMVIFGLMVAIESNNLLEQK